MREDDPAGAAVAATTSAPEDNQLAASYARWRASTLGRITDALEERLLIRLLDEPDGMDVLDVGCGDGRLAARLAGAGAKVTGVDDDPDAIRAASRRTHEGSGSLRFLPTDARALPFAEAAFDRVVAVAVLCFIPDAGRALAEMVRVLRPDGRLVVGDLGRWNLWAADRRVRGWLGHPTWSQARFRSARELHALLAGQGLVDVQVYGAVFYPPCGLAARLMRRMDTWFGRRTRLGAAFVVGVGTKPDRAAARSLDAPTITR
jgi:SAM-dependent methyltransferase